MGHGEAGSELALTSAPAAGSASARRGDGGTDSTGLRASSGERSSEDGRACGCDGDSESGDGRSRCGHEEDGDAFGVETASEDMAGVGVGRAMRRNETRRGREGRAGRRRLRSPIAPSIASCWLPRSELRAGGAAINGVLERWAPRVPKGRAYVETLNGAEGCCMRRFWTGFGEKAAQVGCTVHVPLDSGDIQWACGRAFISAVSSSFPGPAKRLLGVVLSSYHKGSAAPGCRARGSSSRQ